MSFKRKIDMILEARKLQRLSRNRIEQMIGVDGTIYKAYDDDREPADSEIVRKLIGTLGIRQQWWDKDWESGSTDIFITPVQNDPHKHRNGQDDDLYKRIVEGGTEYLLVPRTAFEGNYRFIPIEEIEMHARELERKEAELIRKDSQIQGLHELFKMIASGLTLDLAKIQEAKKNAGV
jgi:hypothetical protein